VSVFNEVSHESCILRHVAASARRILVRGLINEARVQARFHAA